MQHVDFEIKSFNLFLCSYESPPTTLFSFLNSPTKNTFSKSLFKLTLVNFEFVFNLSFIYLSFDV